MEADLVEGPLGLTICGDVGRLIGLDCFEASY